MLPSVRRDARRLEFVYFLLKCRRRNVICYLAFLTRVVKEYSVGRVLWLAQVFLVGKLLQCAAEPVRAQRLGSGPGILSSLVFL